MSLIVRNALLALAITVLLVGTVVFAINRLDRMRLAQISAIEEQIALNTLSLETQFSLLVNAPCENATSTEAFGELADLGNRLSFAEEQLGTENTQVQTLKKQYTLLEIRDYLATRELAKRCNLKPITVLYFYSNDGDCPECDRAGYSLSYLRSLNPSLRVYSFDYHLDLGALRTFRSINKVEPEFPAFIIQGKAYYGFESLEELVSHFPKGSLVTATSTD